MIFKELKLSGAFLIELEKIQDERGFFARSFCKKTFKEMGLESQYPQENISFNVNSRTLRGMHYQASPYEETKLVCCTKGKIFDVIVDIRKASPTFGEWLGIELHENSQQLLYIPSGFAHGFLTLEENSQVHYHMSSEYIPNAARSIHWANPTINIDWPFKPKIISEKDNQANDNSWQ